MRFLLGISVVFAMTSVATADTPPIVFEQEIAPLFATHCVSCHGPEKQKAGLRLDSFVALMRGGDQGAPIVAGDSAGSLLFQAVAGLHEDLAMPPGDQKLDETQLAALEAWIDGGAVGPEVVADAPLEVKTDHWSFQPITQPEPPAVTNADWVRNEIDRFVLARLEQEGLTPSPEADKVTLLRRLYLDLTGLPPTPEEVAQYVADESPFAYQKLVNRLLASPHFGERWGRHWLDIARYADSDGYEKDDYRPWAWRYRHWVIDAINRDLPYDQFIIEQLAGDLLPNASQDDLVATGFHRNTLTNREGGVDQEEFRVAQVVDRTNTTATAFLGLTMACAQCHTHKYDPITQREYFEMYAFFNSGQEKDIPAPLDEEKELYKRDKARWDAAFAKVDQELNAKKESLKPALAEWEKTVDTGEIAWTPLTVESLSASGGTELKQLSDGSILATGAAPNEETYTLNFNNTTEGITGFRVEALIDGSLPSFGPGRASDGNFVLTNFSVKHTPTTAVVENLALKATASSPDELESDGGAKGDQAAIDNNPDTFWDETNSQERYVLQLDFPEPVSFNVMSITGYQHQDHAPKDFKVICDGEVAREITNANYLENLLVFEVPERTCKTVQLEITGYYGLSPAIRELGLYQGSTKDAVTAVRGPAPVNIETAVAEHSQPEYPVTAAIDSDAKSGWAIGGKQPMNSTRNARFVVAQNIQPGTVTLTLEHKYGPSYSLGRFRIYATTDPRARLSTPDDVKAILGIAADQRSAEQQARLLEFYAPNDPGYREVLAKREGLLAGQPKPPETMAQAIVENPEPPTTHIHQRGDFLSPGEEVSPATPAILPPLNPRGEKPDRLDLANWLVRSDNPLTARVAANRLWQYLFEEGLMRTPEDYGTRSEVPTYLPLLDWLATEYMARGWSTKDMIRLIVNSATYKQASEYRPELLERDPQNTLLARQNRYRVAAEITRDLFLASSGLLNDAVGGPSIRPAIPESVANLGYANSVKYPESPGEDKYRRGIYIWFQRTIAYPMLMTFDCPDSNTTTVKRSRSNTPLQALTLLNDPVFFECTQDLGNRLVTEGPEDLRERVRYAFELCLAREPQPAEVEALVGLLEQERAFFAERPEEAQQLAGGVTEGIAPEDAAAHVVLARSIMNLDEFVTRE
jgi:hypothetical protein